MRARAILACIALAVALAASATTGVSAAPGFKTAEDPMLTPIPNDVTVEALLTVGEDIPDTDYEFESIPDGISVYLGDEGQIELFVNHETSKVPFPFATNNPSAATGESDFDNAQVSKLTLDAEGGLLNGEFVIDSSEGFQRFCSNYLATSKEGFTQDILFTNEESPDYAIRAENSWPPPLSNEGAEENGVVIALDVATGDFHPVYGMGRHNHENDVAIPGFDKLVVLSGDDTFTSGPLSDPLDTTSPFDQLAPSQSQLYSYQAGNTKTLLADKGDLWAFVTDDPDVTDYYDFTPGSTDTVTGHFIKVPKTIATGKNRDGSEVTAEDLGYPVPPTDGSWQRDLRDTFDANTNNPQIGIDGPQWVLEYWSQLHHVFDFVRVEDIAYDKRPGMDNVVYVIDSGRGRRPTDSLDTPFRSTNGRIWKMVLDPDDPKQVDSFGVFVDGDDNPVKTLAEIHQPDNVETTPTGLLVTEDPGSSQQFPRDSQDAAATPARLMFVPFVGEGSGTPQSIAKVDHTADGGPTDVHPVPPNPDIGNWGAWESSGIVDASAAFGEGYYLIDVQAHTLWVEKETGPDTFIGTDTTPDDADFTYKREGGQLLLLYIPETIPD